jgi:hypothetical protein
MKSGHVAAPTLWRALLDRLVRADGVQSTEFVRALGDAGHSSVGELLSFAGVPEPEWSRELTLVSLLTPIGE